MTPACSGRNDEEPSAKDSIWKLDRMVSFYLSHSQSSKFLTGGFAKGLQHIDGAAVHHVFQFRQSLIRRAIGVNNHASNFVRTFNRLCRRENTHLAYHGVESNQLGDVRYLVDKGIRI